LCYFGIAVRVNSILFLQSNLLTASKVFPIQRTPTVCGCWL